MPPTLYLIDGHALAYRAYFALTSGQGTFTTRDGEPTAGVFGFTSVLLRLLEREEPDYLAVAFDVGRTFRDDLFADYKGTRDKMPDDLRSQIERMRQLVDAFNIPRLEMENYEADDVLGSLARWAVGKGLGVKIITGDRDLLQLVSERVIVNLPGKSLSDARDYLIDDVIEYLGVRPDQVVDYKALVGDKSDNIPGVPGIGEKTAASLLQAYDTLEGIYAHLEELKPGVRARLEQHREQAELSRKLARIVTDLQVSMDLEQARPQRFDPTRVEDLFRELQFRTLMNRLQALKERYGLHQPVSGQQLSLFSPAAPAMPAPSAVVPSPAVEQHPVSYQVVDTLSKLQSLASRLSEAREISFDTETTSTDQMAAELVGISLAVDGDTGYYIPIGHLNATQQLSLEQVLAALRGPMTDVRIPKVGHNLKYDFVVLARYGLRVKPLGYDTMIAEWLSNPDSRNLGLKNLAWVRLDYRMTPIEELIGTGRNQISMADVPVEKAAAYASADAAIIFRLMPLLQRELRAGAAETLFHEVEMPLVEVLAEMEMAGITLDKEFLGKMSGELAKRLVEIEDQIYQIAGEPFNINSPQQLSQVLFERLKLTPPGRTRKTASGFYSTAAEVLEELRGSHPVLDWVLEFRELAKLKSTYLDALPMQINPQTGRVHTSYSQTGAVTGRIASSNPNLQNIPIRTDLGRQVRQAFVAAPGQKLLSVDYSQVELRIVAHIAKDEAMLAAFHAGQDIHSTTAAAIYGIPLNAVSREQRRHAKAINFGLIYGMSPFGLTRTTGLTLAEAEEFVEAYFRQFPAVKRYLDDTRRKAAEDGYVETLLGRRRYFPGLQSGANRNTRSREEREAINAPIQGTAADIMKIAMLRVRAALSAGGLSARMLLQVHDELVLECPASELLDTIRLVKQTMQKAYALSVPLATEARSGDNWGEMKLVEIE